MAATQTRAARLTLAAIDDWEKGDTDAISDELVIMNLFKSAGAIKTGKSGPQLRWKLVTDRGTVAAMSAEATSTFVPTNPGIELVLGNRGFKTTDLVHEIDLVEAADEHAVFDIMQNRVYWMPEHIGRAWCVEQYTGDGSTDNGYGTNSIIGWNNSIVSTGAYAGITVTTHTAVKGQVLSGGVHGTFSTDPFPSLTASIIACIRGKDAGMGSHYPTHVIMDPTNFGYVLNASNDLRRDTSDSSKKKYGTRTLSFMDCDIVMDRLAPANTNYVINMKTQEVHTPFKKLIQTRRKSEINVLSEAMLCFAYGKSVNKLPRANARVTTA